MSTPYPGGPAGPSWPPPGGPPPGPPSQWAPPPGPPPPLGADPYGSGASDPYGAGPDPYGESYDPSGGGFGPTGPYPPAPPGPPPPRRRRGVALALGGAAVVLVLVAVAAAVALTRSDDPDDLGAGPQSEPDEDWSVEVDLDLADDEDEDGFGGGVLVRSDGDVVIVAKDAPYEEDQDDARLDLVVHDADDGEELWTTEIGSASYAYPVTLLGGDRLLLTEGYDDEARTRLVDARTGEEQWEVEGSTSALISAPFDSQGAALATDRILLDVYDDDGDISEVIAVDADSGEELWSERGVDALDCGDAVITVEREDTDLEDAAPADVEIVGRDGRSGEELWSIDGFPGPCDDGVMGVATADDEVVLVAVGSGAQSDPIDIEGGSSDYTSVAPFGDHVLVTRYSLEDDDGSLAVYPRRGGEATWEEQGGYGFPIGDQLVVSIDDEGDARVISAEDGEEVDDIVIAGFGFDVDGDARCQGALLPRTSLVCDDGSSEVTSYALVGEVGERWTVDVGSDALAVTAGGDRLFVVSADGLTAYR